MKFINIGPRMSVRQCGIAQIVELKDIQDKSVLLRAKRECRLEALIGRPHRTAVFFYNGKILLTPLSAKTIHARIQEATF